VGRALVRDGPTRPRRVQPRRGGDAARFFHRRRLRGARFSHGWARRRRRRIFRRLDGSRRWPHRRHDHGVPAVRAGHGHRRRARQHRAERGVGDRDREFPALCARRARRSQRPPRDRLRAGGAALRQRRDPHPARSDPAEHHADHGGADVADHGLRHPQRRRPLLHRLGRASADRRMGNHGGGRRGVHGLRRMVDRVLSRRRAHGRGILLQPARRRAARHRRSATAHLRQPMTETVPLLDVADLTVEFSTRRGIVRAVEHVDVRIAKGETVGIVGESGSGKSVTSYAVMRILDRAGRIAEGAVHFTGLDVRAASEDQMRNLRGREMSMIFQNPRAALNPIRKVGRQIEDVLKQHSQVDSSALTDKAIEMLDQVRIARPRERYHAYPFELSGGMCQRVVIALALACRPQLLIADEPTTGLDVTTQKTVMDLIVELTKQRGMSTILITHDLGLAATYCDRVAVMEKGRVVEAAPWREIFTAPSHAYTRKLMRATPRPGVSLRDLLPEDERSCGMESAQPQARSAPSPNQTPACRGLVTQTFAGSGQARSRLGEGWGGGSSLWHEARPPTLTPTPNPSPQGGGEPTESAAGSNSKTPGPLVVVEKLVKEYPRKGVAGLAKIFQRKPAPQPETFRAVDGISFTINRGESVGLVGESGCGKSTTSTMVMRLI